MPIGAIIRLTRTQPPAVDIGCLNNLYQSVENFDVKRLRTEACKTMLLHPRNGVETHCKNLKLQIDDTEPTRYFLCSSSECTQMLLSLHQGALCCCGKALCREMHLSTVNQEKMVSAIRDGGVFVKGLTRLLISDDLQVMTPSTAACFSLFSKLGVVNGSTIEERTFDVGVNEVLNLLKCSLVSKTPLTETLLKHKPVPELSKKDFNQESSSSESQLEPVAEKSNGDGKISVKIIVSKSRNMICYAEAGEDFVDLLFSFLTLPLGYIVKKMQGSSSSKGCLDELYSSVHDLDTEHYMKSNEHKEMLISPKVAPGFCYENQPLDIEEALYPQYHYKRAQGYCDSFTAYETTPSSGKSATALNIMDPKSHKETSKGGGFVDGPAMFTVTDNLIILPISPLSGVSVLNKLNVSFNDVEERIVHVGNEEAMCLLVASFVSDFALTSAFIRGEPKQE